MRIIKLALLSFIILFLLVTAISLLIPSEIRISKAINLAPPGDSVMVWIKDQGLWSRWHPAFLTRDSIASSPPLTIKEQKASDSEMVFTVGRPGKTPVVNGWRIHRYAYSDSITLQWYMDFHLPWYPWHKFGSLFYENTYGVMMERGLSNLKTLQQGRP